MDAGVKSGRLMEGLHRSGAIDKQTMREFDAACLAAAEPLAPEEIRALRAQGHCLIAGTRRAMSPNRMGTRRRRERGVVQPHSLSHDRLRRIRLSAPNYKHRRTSNRFNGQRLYGVLTPG
jgi:putative transcriptional regulator